MRRAHNPSRAGFTVVELLVVIGVIILLAALVTYGMGKFVGGNAERDTRITLQNLQGMLKTLDDTTKLEGVQHTYPSNWPPPPTDLTQISVRASAGNQYMRDTRVMMYRLQSVPSNKKALENLPPNRLYILRNPDGSLVSHQLPGATGVNLQNTPVVLDSFDNPILYIRASGVPNIETKDKSISFNGPIRKGARVKHGGFWWTALSAKGGTPTPGDDWFKGIMSPNGQPFFASAGADGNFAEGGDDNLYSFE